MTAEQRAGLSDAALAMTQPCINELIKDISRRVQKAGAITDTAEYQLYRAQALGESKKAIEQAVSKQIGISEEVIASLFEYVADKSLSLDENGSLKRMTEAYTRMTQSKTRELLRDLWADTPEGKVQPLQTAYARAMDFAFRQVATGTLDLNTAIRRAVTPLAKRGLRTIEQKSGRSVGIEYACRRYIMDQLGQLDDEIQHADHDALGCDGWEISAHAACAPDHEPIQGQQYGDAEFEKLNNSLQRRIGHLNCGHTANPIILGVNAPQYTEAQLQKFKDDNERGVVYNGYRYTLYEAGQEQSRPTLIIGKTIMGKGVVTEEGQSYEGKCSTHGQPLSAAGASFAKTIAHLGGNPDEPFAIFPEVEKLYADRKAELLKVAADRKVTSVLFRKSS